MPARLCMSLPSGGIEPRGVVPFVLYLSPTYQFVETRSNDAIKSSLVKLRSVWS